MLFNSKYLDSWQKNKLSDVSKIIDSLHKTPKYSKKGFPMVRVTDIKKGLLKLNNTLVVNETIYKEYTIKYEPKKHDIVMSRVGTYGVASYVYTDEKFCLGQNTVIIKPDIDSKFLYYYLQSPFIQNQIESKVVGSTYKTLSLKNIRGLDLYVPNLLIQKEISKILFNLDLKNYYNNRISEIYEKISKTLFKLWFVDFEFPDKNGEPYRSRGGVMKDSEFGKIPENWNIQALDEVADFLNGFAWKKYATKNDDEPYYSVIKIKELREGITDTSDRVHKKIPEDYIIHNGDIIFSWSASLLIKIWTGGIGALNQHLFKVTSKYHKWFYYLWIKHHLAEFQKIAEDKATTMGHIKRSHLSEALVLVPDNDSFIKMSKIMIPIIEVIINNELENQSVLELRDVLLPRLMSGEMRVPMEEP